MLKNGVRNLPVLDRKRERVLGVLSVHDIISTLTWKHKVDNHLVWELDLASVGA